ncbi:MAG: hypothetical protein ACI9W6_002794, partial [Motiliproteus sp.]
MIIQDKSMANHSSSGASTQSPKPTLFLALL